MALSKEQLTWLWSLLICTIYENREAKSQEIIEFVAEATGVLNVIDKMLKEVR